MTSGTAPHEIEAYVGNLGKNRDAAGRRDLALEALILLGDRDNMALRGLLRFGHLAWCRSVYVSGTCSSCVVPTAAVLERSGPAWRVVIASTTN